MYFSIHLDFLWSLKSMETSNQTTLWFYRMAIFAFQFCIHQSMIRNQVGTFQTKQQPLFWLLLQFSLPHSSGERIEERWNPTQNVRTILLSVISLLNEPNTYSPANVDASVMYRKWRDSHGKDNEYPNIIRYGFWLNQKIFFFVLLDFNFHFCFLYSKQALAGKLDAEREGIVVPLTLEDYCIKPKSKPSNQEMAVSELGKKIILFAVTFSTHFSARFDRFLWRRLRFRYRWWQSRFGRLRLCQWRW